MKPASTIWFPPIAWPQRDQASRAVRDYLSALDRESAEPPGAAGGRTSTPRMAISLTDPEAAWIAYRKMRSIFAYHANYLIDNKCGVIVDAEGNRANRIDENQAPAWTWSSASRHGSI